MRIAIDAPRIVDKLNSKNDSEVETVDGVNIGRFSKRHPFDIVHTHNYLTSAAILFQNRGVGSRLVQTSYDPYAERPAVS